MSSDISGTGWLQDGVEPMLAWGHGTPAWRSLVAREGLSPPPGTAEVGCHPP